jgi:hypothetical protein
MFLNKEARIMENTVLEKILEIGKKSLESEQLFKEASQKTKNEIVKDFLSKYSYKKCAFLLKLQKVASISISYGNATNNNHLTISNEESECRKDNRILQICLKKENAILELINELVENENLKDEIHQVIEHQQNHINSGLKKLKLMEENLEKSGLE